jgi:hypothetical protein
VISGQGTVVFPNGSKYEGLFKDGLFHGKGFYTYADGTKYTGDFKNGLFEGKGTLFSDGQLYVGEFKEGNHYGQGTITYYDKSQETGEWKDGKFIVSQTIKAPKKPKSQGDQAFGSDVFLPIDSWGKEQEQEDFSFENFAAEQSGVGQ